MNINKQIQLAFQCYKSGNLQQAEIILRQILKIQPTNADIYFQLGSIYKSKGQVDEAITSYQMAIQLNPRYGDAYNDLGNSYKIKGQVDNAITCYQKAIQIDPNHALAYYNLGNIFLYKGQVDDAIVCYQKTLQLNPNLAEAYNNLGNAFKDRGQLNEAITCFQKAIQLKPNHALAYNNQGIALEWKGQLNEAITCYQKAIQLNPNLAEAYNNLGNAFKDRGQLNEAEIYFKRALKINPDYSTAYSNLLLDMNYNSQYDIQAIFSEHLLFAKQFEKPLSSTISSHTNDCSPARRLKIGYVSPDFKRHPVACFIESVLASHHREHFEVFCYSNSLFIDEVTRRIQGYTDQWRTIVGMSDERVVELIRKDRIDILVDLTGHTANNRMLLFARKPSPIQVSWIGYPATTGLSTIDYKIVDDYTDPPGMTEQFYTEKLIRMPESFLCYLPDPDSPEVGNLPSLATGHITFGSFNNFPKMTPKVISIWIRILKAVPDSRLVLKARSLSDGMTREQALNMFTGEGIQGQRIKLHSWLPSSKEHLNLYNQVDIALDTFSYNGTTTTCEALWMGVPVITIAGNTHASRVGVSILSNVGLNEFIAKTHDEYIGIAINLSSDIKRLQLLRKSLRNRMSQSPLTDAKRFTANLEMCYRKMWERWCKSV